MPIGHISVGDVGSIAKINEAIDKANLVDSKAAASTVTTHTSQISTLQTGLSAEATTRSAADAAEAAARQSADAVLHDEIVTLIAGHSIYPGYSRNLFTSTITGPPESAAALSGVTYVTSARGRVVRASTPVIVAPVERAPIDPGVIEYAAFAVQRISDTPDPDNDAVELGIQWLDKSFVAISTTIFETLSLTEAAGRVVRSFVFASASGVGIDVAYPTGSIYAVPFVRIYGVYHQTDVEFVGRRPLDGLSASIAALAAASSAQQADISEANALSSATQSSNSAADAADSALEAQALVDAAGAGFIGFVDGIAYDFGSVSDPMTYFNQDWGTL